MTSEEGQSNVVWLIVGVLAIIALVIYILPHIN
jgi:uncharacterized membrane protein